MVPYRGVALRRAGRSAGGLACSRVTSVRCGVGWGARCALCCCAVKRWGGCYLGGDGGAAPTAASAAPGVGVASSRWAPWPMCRALPGGLARSPAAACARRGTAEAAVLSAPSRGGVAVTVVSAAPRGVRSGSVLAQRAHSRGSVVHAQREHAATHTHHRASRGDITTRSAVVAKAPRSKRRHSSRNVCVLLCGPVGLGSAFKFDFSRARSRDMANGAFAAERWLIIENCE